MSGAGRMVFQPGAVLTASQVQNYLQDQAVMVFAGTAARGSAIGSGTASAGMMSYLQDTNSLEIYRAYGTAITGWESTNFSTNYAINGNFDIFQRSTFSSQTSSGYSLDRWYVAVGGTVTATQQTTGVPIGSQYCMRIAYNAASSFGNVSQAFEANTVNQLKGKNVTLSVKLRRSSGFATSLNVTIQKNSTADTMTGGSWSNVATTVVANASLPTGTTSADWYTAYVSATIPTDGTANGLRIQVTESAAGSSGAYYEISQIQFEEGLAATVFRRHSSSIQGELAACQRYYQKYSGTYMAYGIVACETSTNARGSFTFSSMRGTPSVTISAANTFTLWGKGAPSTVALTDLNAAGKVMIQCGVSGASVGQAFDLTDAGSNTSYIELSSEL